MDLPAELQLPLEVHGGDREAPKCYAGQDFSRKRGRWISEPQEGENKQPQPYWKT